MTRGESTQTKVHYKGPNTQNDFIIFIDDLEAMEKWKGDKSVPLAQVVQSFKIFTTHQQGASGNPDGASNQILEAEFGTKNEEEVIKKIIEDGEVQQTESHARQGAKNDTRGGGNVTR